MKTFHSIKQIRVKASQTLNKKQADEIWHRLTNDMPKEIDRKACEYTRISRNVIRRRKVGA